MTRSILFLTNAYPDFDSSYRGIFIKKMAALLRKEGYHVSVVTPKIYKRSHYFEVQGGIKVYRFPFFARDKLLIEYNKIPYLRMIFYYLTGFLWTFYGALRNGCKIIHVHWAIPTGLIGVLVGHLLKKSVIVTVHGSDFRMATASSKILNKIFLYVCHRARRIFCVSELQAKEVHRMGVKGEKILTLPMGIEEIFLEAGKNRREKLNHQGYTVFSNRNLLPLYNVSLLIRAIPLVLQEEPSTKFLIAGDGPERENLVTEAEGLKVTHSVNFLGRVPHEKMADLLGQADIYVSTSLHDGTSVSLLEAMGSGAFPIVTDIPSNREWIQPGRNGFLVPVDREDFLAEKIIEAIRNQAILGKSKKENIAMIKEKALWTVNIERINEIYANLLSPQN